MAPIHYAAASGDAECVDMLMAHGASPEQRTQVSLSRPPSFATQPHPHHKHPPAPVTPSPSLVGLAQAGWTPLHYAAHVDSLVTAKRLVAAGAMVEPRSEVRRWPSPAGPCSRAALTDPLWCVGSAHRASSASAETPLCTLPADTEAKRW